ncbi:HAD hydrolase-like protein [Corynebacterium sp. Q4381]|uniref:HAD hydrolase-like protein n=1 Tax=Corynebacterium sp. Marseille-Q4381 TaxID=3121597 RepID=UPI002FE66CA1
MHDLNHKATLLFDVDGTLIDSYPGIREGFVRALNAIGHPVPDESFLKRIPGPPMRESMTNAGLDGDQVERAMEVYSDFMSGEGWQDFTVYKGMADLVAKLRGEGFGVVTATSKSEKFASLALERAGILKHVEFLGAANADVGRVTKIDVIRHVLDNVEVVNPLMIGDRMHDYEGAAEFGLDSVAVTWGYGDEDEWSRATHVARDASELEGIVRNHAH